MKKGFLQKVIPVLSLVLTLVCTACSGKESGNPEKQLLSLNFDEGAGNQVLDGAGQAQPAVVKYLFTNAAYMDARSPEWRMAFSSRLTMTCRISRGSIGR